MRKKIEKSRKNPIFFISHSSNDGKAVELFVKEILRGGLEFKASDIFASSIEGHKIASGDDFIDAIENGIKKCEIVFLFLSENYKSSEICLNEMGASWVLDSCYTIPVIYGYLPYDKVGALQITKQIEKVGSSDSLDNILETLKQLNVVTNVNTSLWSGAKKTYLRALDKVDFNPPAQVKLSKEEFEILENEKEEAEETISRLIEEKSSLEDLVSELQAEPDIDKRKEIAKEATESEDVEEKFCEAVDNVKKYTKKFARIVNLIILSNYFGLPQPSVDGYRDEIDDAIRDGYLDGDDNLSTIERKKIIDNYHQALEGVNMLLRDRELCEWYECEYDEYFAPNVQSFWEEHYEI